ncbi:PDR/VanB family oxidoreductase [Streptomyces sp. NPDC015345]|uniref:PDR/VanB family oxidoreductase n=1 Tax=Streptomyces sp. NPDC015345 TaxID=3364953 RepID=UPI0036F5A35E
MPTRPQPPTDLYRPERPDLFLTQLTRLRGALFFCLTLPCVRRGSAVPAPAPVPAKTPLTVRSRRALTPDVVEFTLTAERPGEPLPAWQPGSHLDITLPSGRMRSYSLCGDPVDTTAYRIAVRRLAGGRGGSRELHDAVVPGTRLTARGPFCTFPFAAEPAVLFLAGGIGITPLLPMVHEAARRGLDWHLVRTGRDHASLPYAAEAAALDPAGTRITTHCYDTDGYPDPASLLARAPRHAAVYCCGPAPLLDSVRRALSAEADQPLHAQRFTTAPVAEGAPFTLRLRDGTLLPVPAGQAALDVLLDARPAAPLSCRQGFCGTCRVQVLDGTPDHRDHVLTPKERKAGALLPCVSRAKEGTLLAIDI